MGETAPTYAELRFSGEPPAPPVRLTEARRSVLVGRALPPGRAPVADVALACAMLARRHCRVTWEPGARFVVLEDVESPGGVYLNGERVSAPSRLAEGDEAKLGRFMLAVAFG
jgi:pSer/pThr/pTyr-binding forkhead associated (FHA) protein